MEPALPLANGGSCDSGVGGLLGERRTVSEVTEPRIVWGSLFGSPNSTPPGVWVPGTAGVLVAEGSPLRGVARKGVGVGAAEFEGGALLANSSLMTSSLNLPLSS